MTDLPIPFKAPMVRAILREIKAPGTGKTMTRRLADEVFWSPPEMPHHPNGRLPLNAWQVADGGPYFKLKYRPGDRLYVREPWRTLQKWDDLAPRNLADDRSKVTYEADPERRNPLWAFGKLRPSMFMPRWASRITLIVTDVKVERLQDISEADAWAEGVWNCGEDDGGKSIPGEGRELFQNLWSAINGPDAWARNDWVTAYTFRPHLCNIDQMGSP